jgi:hypothetical protein
VEDEDRTRCLPPSQVVDFVIDAGLIAWVEIGLGDSMDPIANSLPAGNFPDFFRKAAYYRYHEWFQENERDYKIRLSGRLQDARAAIPDNPLEGMRLLAAALRSQENNLINWRDMAKLYSALGRDPQRFAAQVALLLEGDRPTEDTVRTFCRFLGSIEIFRAGSQLAVVSTLLLALSPYKFPPVRTRAFQAAFAATGDQWFQSGDDAARRWHRSLSYLDYLVESSREFGVELRDHLDAQGVIWCITHEAWGGVPATFVWPGEPTCPDLSEEDRSFLASLSEEAEMRNLAATERTAIVLARRGQGRFREDLISLWRECAVTSCAVHSLLRASHLKPWNLSSSHERLDRFNGLLLTPNLDLALDSCLITFDDDGTIRVSNEVTERDRRALGFEPTMRLRNVKAEHLPYLRYHRTKKFKP